MASRSPAKCISCAYPVTAEGSIMAVLAHLREMVQHVGYSVERLLLQDASEGSISLELDLRPSSSKRARPSDLCTDGPSKRFAVPGCRLCASSCCSTNSLCKANVCGHHNEEVSNPQLSSADIPSENLPPDKTNVDNVAATASRHRRHRHHHHHHSRHHHRHHPQQQQPQQQIPRQRNAAPQLEAPHEPPRLDFQPVPEDDHHETRFQSLPPSPNISKQPQPKNSFDRSRRPSLSASAPFAHSTTEPSKQTTRPQSSMDVDPNNIRDQPTGWTASTAPTGASYEPNRAPMSVDFPSQSLSLPISSTAPLVTAVAVTTSRPPGLSEPPEEHIVTEIPDSHSVEPKTGQHNKPDQAEHHTTVDPSAVLRPTPALICSPCNQTFPSELDLRKHQYVTHKDDKIITRTAEGRFLCLMHSCPQSFVRRHVMERHFKTRHMMLRDFPCSSCDRVFADASTREAHRSAVHEKRKPWRCDHCSSRFTQSSSLGKHRRRFHQENTTLSAPSKFVEKS